MKIPLWVWYIGGTALLLYFLYKKAPPPRTSNRWVMGQGQFQELCAFDGGTVQGNMCLERNTIQARFNADGTVDKYNVNTNKWVPVTLQDKAAYESTLKAMAKGGAS